VDSKAIADEKVRAKIYTEWMHDWLEANLTEEQQTYKFSRRSSIFAAWMKQRYGGKLFLMALLETGITWAPSKQLLEIDNDDAVEHVAKCFVGWLSDVLEAIARHKNAPETIEARERSGTAYGVHGLTPQQETDRQERSRARADYWQTCKLEKQLLASKGKGKGGAAEYVKGKAKGKGGAAQYIEPKSWWAMSRSEIWWLGEYWNGNLKWKMEEAEKKVNKVEAKPFRMLT
jgi:hypothetical protein